jgi:phosphocarrier protein
MAERTVEVRNRSGLHARPAADFVKAATALGRDVRVTNLTRDPERSAAARSILGILSLGVSKGHTIRLTADGDGADEALERLVALVKSGLGEPVDPS